MHRPKASVLPALWAGLALVLIGGVEFARAQRPFTASTPETCAATNVAAATLRNRFDANALNCVDCTVGGTVLNRITDGAGGCKCDAGYVATPTSTTDFDFLAFTCTTDCGASGQAAFRDSHACVPCLASSGATYDSTRRDCVCAASNAVLVEKSITGAWLTAKTCVVCPNGTTAMADRYTCTSCPDPLMTWTSSGCVCPTGYTRDESHTYCLLTSLLSGLTLYPATNAVKMKYQDVYSSDSSSVTSVDVSSWKVGQLYLACAIRCRNYKIRSACSCIANLCALQQYDGSSVPCSLFDAIAGDITATSNDFSDWKSALPFLEYSTDGYLSAKTLQSEVSLHSSDASAVRSKIQALQFKLVTWSLNGTLLSIDDLTNQLQLCSSVVSASPTAFTLAQLTAFLRFGTSYSNACTLDLSKILSASKTGEVLLYDLYYVDRGPTWFPVPVKVLNRRDASGNHVNRNSGGEILSTGSLQLSNRFFLFDTLTGATSELGQSEPVVVQYAQSITLRVTVQESKTLLYPPLLVINYQQRAWTDISRTSAAVSFAATYTISQSGVLTAQTVMFALAVVLWFALWVLSICNEQRVNKLDAMGPAHCTRVLLNGFALMADFLFWLAFIFCFYYFCFFKGQSSSFILMPLPGGSEENMLVAVVVVAFVGKIWRIVYLLYKQLTVDLFLVDYEGSRGNPHTVASGAGQQNPESAQNIRPAAWRRVLIARKLCELQVIRAQSMTFTFLLLILLLRGVGLEYLATSQPTMSNLNPDAAPINKILRFAVSTFFLLLIAGAQIVLRRFVLYRYWRDPFADFVDLCSVSNISLFLFDQRYHSYFIYGKSVHASADVSLEQLRFHMELERRTVTRDRGLDGNDKTVFEFYVNRIVADKFAALNLRLQIELQNRERASAGAADRRQQQLQHSSGAGDQKEMGIGIGIALDSALHRAYDEMNEFLIAFIERTVPSAMDQPMFEWSAGQRSYWNRRFRLPPDIGDGTRNWRFEDDDHSFSETFLCGIEYELLIFTCLLYACSDLAFNNSLASAFVAWIITWLIARARAHWGLSNVSRKSLVDDVFLT